MYSEEPSENTQEIIDEQEFEEGLAANRRMRDEAKNELFDDHMYQQGYDYFEEKIPWEEIVKQGLDKDASFMKGYQKAQKTPEVYSYEEIRPER